jgi:hypothetical protein
VQLKKLTQKSSFKKVTGSGVKNYWDRKNMVNAALLGLLGIPGS